MTEKILRWVIAVGVVSLLILGIIIVVRPGAMGATDGSHTRKLTTTLTVDVGTDLTVTGTTTSRIVTTSGNVYIGGTLITADQTLTGTLTGVAANFSGLITGSAGLSITAGDVRLVSLVETGVTTTFSASSTAKSATGNIIEAAKVCNQKLIPVALSGSSTLVIYLPPTTTLYADCLTTDGDLRWFKIKTSSTTGSFTIAAGTGMTLTMTSSSVIGVGEEALIFCQREDATNTYCDGINFGL